MIVDFREKSRQDGSNRDLDIFLKNTLMMRYKSEKDSRTKRIGEGYEASFFKKEKFEL